MYIFEFLLRLFRWRSTINTNTQSSQQQQQQRGWAPEISSNPQPQSAPTTLADSSTSSIGSSSVALNLPSRQMSSNNLLNSNLSGSFKESDDEALFHDANATVYGSINKSRKFGNNRGGEGAASTSEHTNLLVQPSSSHGRLGVAALPNMEFSPSPPDSKRKPNNEFIV